MAKKGKRQPRPKSDAIANLLRPHKPEGVQELAAKLMANETPTIGLINGCLVASGAAASEEYQDYPMYDPVVAESINRLNCRVAIKGQASKTAKEPSDWSDSFGKWQPGYKIEDSVRMSHIRDLRKYVLQRGDDNPIVKVGSYEYVIGDDQTSAIFLAKSSRSGNYAANIMVAKRLSLNENAEIKNLVGRFNNDVVTVKVGSGVVHLLPNQLVTWGRMMRDDRAMSYAQIRKAVADGDTKGMRFDAVDPIVGESFAQKQFVSNVMKLMNSAGTKDEDGKTGWDRFAERGGKKVSEDQTGNVWRNLLVQMRVSPLVWYAFGFENFQWGLVPIAHYGDSLDEQLVRVVINARDGEEWHESRPKARLRINPETAKKTPKQKTKTDKPKTKKRVAVKKVEPKPKKRLAKKSPPVVEPAAAEEIIPTLVTAGDAPDEFDEPDEDTAD